VLFLCFQFKDFSDFFYLCAKDTKTDQKKLFLIYTTANLVRTTNFFESTLLARQLQQERTQMEAQ